MKEKLKAKKEYFILSAFVFILMLAVFLVGQVFPFGNNSFGCYDFYFQVLDTTASIFHAGGRANLFFTFDIANGLSTFSSLFYACFSPFTVVLLLGGIQNIRFLFPLYIFLKFLTISLIALYFIRKYFKNLNSCTQIIFSLLYTFGCYSFMSVTWCVWLDLMIYVPLAFIAFDYMQKTGKIRWLSLVLALMILTSFSISLFTILYSIVIFALYLWLVVPKENRKTICLKTILAVSIAVVSTLFVSIPSLIEMMHSTRTGGLFSSIHEAEPTKYFWENFGLLLSSAVPIFLSVMFLFKNKLKTKTGKFYFYLFMLCIIPALINNINVAINFSAYAGYPLRLGALFNFVFNFMALKYLDTRQKQETAEKSNKIFFIPLTLFCLLTFGVGLIICYITNHYTGRLAYNLDLDVNLLIPVILFAFTILMIFLLTRFKKLSKNASKIFYCVILGVLVFTQTLTYLSGCTIEIGTEKEYSYFSSIITNDDKYANVKSRLNMNQITSGYSSISGFCSMIDENTISTYTTLGYTDDFHDISTTCSNLFADMLSGIKYEISDVELNLPYLTKIAQNEKSYLYKYNLYLGHAYYVDELPQVDNDEEFLIRLNKIYKTLSKDEEDLLVKLEANIEYSTTPKQVEEGSKFEDETKATCTLLAPNFNSLIYLQSNYFGNYISQNSNLVNSEGSTFLEFCDIANKQLSYSLDIDKQTIIDEIYFYALDYDKLVSLYETMSANLPTVNYTADTITINFDNANGKYLVVNHPQIYGYQYTLNNEKTQAQSFIGFVTFDIRNLSSGSATIKYTYPIIKISLICLGVSLIIVAILVLLVFFFNKLPKKFISLVFYCFTTVAIIISIYYFAVPIVLMMIPI